MKYLTLIMLTLIMLACQSQPTIHKQVIVLTDTVYVEKPLIQPLDEQPAMAVQEQTNTGDCLGCPRKRLAGGPPRTPVWADKPTTQTTSSTLNSNWQIPTTRDRVVYDEEEIRKYSLANASKSYGNTPNYQGNTLVYQSTQTTNSLPSTHFVPSALRNSNSNSTSRNTEVLPTFRPVTTSGSIDISTTTSTGTRHSTVRYSVSPTNRR